MSRARKICRRFTDAAGRAWSVVIDEDAERNAAAAGFDLAKLANDQQAFARVFSDFSLFSKLIVVIVRPAEQAEHESHADKRLDLCTVTAFAAAEAVAAALYARWPGANLVASIAILRKNVSLAERIAAQSKRAERA